MLLAFEIGMCALTHTQSMHVLVCVRACVRAYLMYINTICLCKDSFPTLRKKLCATEQKGQQYQSAKKRKKMCRFNFSIHILKAFKANGFPINICAKQLKHTIISSIVILLFPYFLRSSLLLTSRRRHHRYYRARSANCRRNNIQLRRRRLRIQPNNTYLYVSGWEKGIFIVSLMPKIASSLSASNGLSCIVYF